MEILKQDFRKGYARIKVTDIEDLWHLSQAILPGDFVQGKSVRKIKIEKGGEKTESIRKTIIVKICVEKVSFDKGIESLRLNGKIANEIEDAPKGSHHSLDVAVGDIIDIDKDEFLDYQIKYLKEASSGKKGKILIVVLERDEALFAVLKAYGAEILGEIKGSVEKKYAKEKINREFYDEVMGEIEGYEKRGGYEAIIIGSPAFWKDEIYKRMNADMRKKAILANCNNTGKAGIQELLKRDEVRKALAETRISVEANGVEELLQEIAKEGKAVYGFKETKEAAYSGAVEILLITTRMINSMVGSGSYRELNGIMKTVESGKGAVRIINSDNEPGEKLDGIGGIAAILRYKTRY